jgi:hypothetical protein
MHMMNEHVPQNWMHQDQKSGRRKDLFSLKFKPAMEESLRPPSCLLLVHIPSDPCHRSTFPLASGAKELNMVDEGDDGPWTLSNS